MTVGANTPIGVLTSNVTPATAWTSQNYTVGQTVTYANPNPIFGTQVYTCILNTVANDLPSVTTYWQPGFALAVSPTVIAKHQRVIRLHYLMELTQIILVVLYL